MRGHKLAILTGVVVHRLSGTQSCLQPLIEGHLDESMQCNASDQA